MLAKPKPQRVPRSDRQGPRGGTTRPNALRNRGSKTAGINAATLGRFRALTFSTILGSEVVLKKTGKVVYDQLFDCYSRYYFLVNGSHPEPLTTATIEALHDAMNQLIGKASCNIESNDGGQYYFIVYQESKHDWGWFTIDIKDIVLHLKRENIILHDLFIEFLGMFIAQTGIDLWTGDTMSNALDWFEEQFLNFKEEYPDEKLDIEQYNNVLFEYNEGLACEYAGLINRSVSINPADLKLKAVNLNIDHPLIEIICKGCDLASEDLCVYSFDYEPDEEGENYMEGALKFPTTFNIIWTWDCPVTEQQREYLDCAANNEGCLEPYKFLVVKPDCNKLFENTDWVYRVQEYFMEVNTIIDQILKKKNEQNNGIPEI